MTRTGRLVCAVIAVTAGVLLVITACGKSERIEPSVFEDTEREAGSSGASGSGGLIGASGGPTHSTIAPPTECTKMDIVFAIDNSGSMAEEQANLAANFPKFVQVINDYKTKGGDALDYRLAVTTSDDKRERGTFGTTRAKAAPPGCLPGPNRPWLERRDGDVAAQFACRAQYGTAGSDIERPLENVLLGITVRIADSMNTMNGESFLREDALLAFVIITDEDEGSAGGAGDLARPMADYPVAFDKVKSDRARWAAAVIAGPSACSSPGFGNATEAVRLKKFVADVGKNGVFASICTGDLTDGLTQALATFNQACKDFPSRVH